MAALDMPLGRSLAPGARAGEAGGLRGGGRSIADHSRKTHVKAELVDAGPGTSADDYEGIDVEGRVVASACSLALPWRRPSEAGSARGRLLHVRPLGALRRTRSRGGASRTKRQVWTGSRTGRQGHLESWSLPGAGTGSGSGWVRRPESRSRSTSCHSRPNPGAGDGRGVDKGD